MAEIVEVIEPFELLEKWQTDVIFAARQSGFACDWTPLHDDAMYAILPADYPTNGRDFFPIEAFAGKEFLMPYGRFDIDVGAAFRKYGVEPIIRPCYVDDETVIRMVGKGLGISMMAEMMIRGKLTGVKTLPVRPCVSRELGNGFFAYRHFRRCGAGVFWRQNRYFYAAVYGNTNLLPSAE